ncbi:ryncolin-1 [Aedes albopictus]|uniref:Fibrinogen C-terminal domain-containing protein n=1 Tax=Aedes albopictus TaxID=7160 RepID=A0ABM1ZVE9_AEDAL|nr:ryncolin-1-like [Aedes albopictus]
MVIKFVIVTFALASCCAAKLVEDGDETPSGSWFGFELLITHLESIEQKLTKLDYLEQKLAKLEITEKAIDILERKITKLDIVEQKLFNVEQIIMNQAKNVFQSCSEEPSKMSGKYRLQPDSNEQPFVGFCEQEKYDGGWLVIQHRFDGSVNFYRDWEDYKNGFGKIDGEFWIGLERLHKLTQNNPMTLMVEIEDYDGNYGYARYDEFEIGNEDEKYVLEQLSGYSGSLQDSMSDSQGFMFTTRDSDNSEIGSDNCAQQEQGAWWYMNCGYTNPNGPYHKKEEWKKIYWYGHRAGVELKFFRMMIK